MQLSKKLKNKEIHRIDDTRRVILDDNNKILACGQCVALAESEINWHWIKKSEQD